MAVLVNRGKASFSFNLEGSYWTFHPGELVEIVDEDAAGCVYASCEELGLRRVGGKEMPVPLKALVVQADRPKRGRKAPA